MSKYLLFNFKNNPSDLVQLTQLLEIYQKYLPEIIQKFKIVLFPPSVYLIPTKTNLKIKTLLGSQDVFWFNKIQATGAITPLMLKSLGIQYVIIGHSERKLYFLETNQMINWKMKSCLNNKLTPVLCIGEKERDNQEKTLNFHTKQEIFEQLNYAFRGIRINKSTNLLVAYEPLWAIGKGITPNPQTIQDVAALIRFWLSRRFGENLTKHFSVLYGGSVNHQNIKEIISLKNINGVLIGGASTNKNELIKIFKQLIS